MNMDKIPGVVLDSLRSLDTVGISVKNHAYYSLLTTIAKNKSGITERRDSVITTAASFFEKENDHYNLCRSLLYKGIIQYNLTRPAFKIYTSLKSAEEVYNKHKLDNPQIEAEIYRYLGKTLRNNRKYKESEPYFKKSIRINDSIENHSVAQFCRLDYFWSYQLQNKKREAYSCLLAVSLNDTAAPIIRYNFYNAFARYYADDRKYDLSNKYLRKMIRIKDLDELKKMDHSGIYFFIASNFKQIHETDSAIFYGLMAISPSYNLFFNIPGSYNRLLGDMYMRKGDYKSASEYYRDASRSSGNNTTVSTWVRDPEVDMAYEVSKKDSKLDKARGQLKVLHAFIAFLTLLVLSAIVVIRFGRRAYRRCMEDKDKQSSAIEAELKRSRFINLIHETSVGALPKLVDDVNRHANRSRKFSSELSDDLNDSINNIRSFSKNNLSAIAQNESFLAANPNVKYLTSLSDLEIVILILVDLKFSTKEISDLLNNTPASVRAIKTRIKEKILAMGGLPFNPQNTFLIFSKEQNHRC
ncbi:MAG: tetratricopeptide repeat protein [Bacteroidales bacterium]|jgi:tetratricopeptide (TPR) repeat protein